mmetsp:Transcript_62000/g.128271  ORF Transcript_62000/g.128271 Transcript_62000/m.128271 type:complete len:203 (+) Transcript_62000:1075-1683(+)
MPNTMFSSMLRLNMREHRERNLRWELLSPGMREREEERRVEAARQTSAPAQEEEIARRAGPQSGIETDTTREGEGTTATSAGEGGKGAKTEAGLRRAVSRDLHQEPASGSPSSTAMETQTLPSTTATESSLNATIAPATTSNRIALRGPSAIEEDQADSRRQPHHHLVRGAVLQAEPRIAARNKNFRRECNQFTPKQRFTQG